MRKIILGLGFTILGNFSFAQNGLDSIIVEKYYVSDATDSTGSDTDGGGTLPVGSVTYRVFADLKDGYEFQALYGEFIPGTTTPLHTLTINTSTTFFNNEDRGATTANAIASNKLSSNTVALDSYFSVGAAATGQMAVLKSEDDGAANLIAANSILKNVSSAAGIPLTTQDGMIAGSPEAVTFVGFSNETDVFDATSQAGNSFSTSNGSVASLNGSVGPTANNRILLGQFTTDGTFHFELNIQIGLVAGGGVEKYVASNPEVGELTHSSLTYTSSSTTVNASPTVSISNPTPGSSVLIGSVVTVEANASDSDGNVDSVQFFLDGTILGTDLTSPYSYTLTAKAGTHTLTAMATDNSGNSSTSTAVIFDGTSTANAAPTVSIESPLNASTHTTGDLISITATATDTDGTIDSVQFYVDGTLVGMDASSPYSFLYTATLGSHTLTAKATDNSSAQTTSSAVSIIVTNPTTTNINQEEGNQSIVVFPNPAADHVNIEINTLKKSRVVYSLYNVLGNIVLYKDLGLVTGHLKEVVDLSGMATGQYIIQLLLDDVVSTKKIIKN